MTYPTNQIPSNNPQNFAISTPIGCERNPRDPNAQDNTFPPSWEWQNTTTGMFFKCISATIAGAVWTPFVPSAAGTVSTLSGDQNPVVLVGPNGSGDIKVFGDGVSIETTGNAGANTLTVSLIGGKVASQSYVTNINPSVVPTASGVIDLTASTSTYTDGTVANTIKIELQGTNHTLFVGRGVHSPATTISAGTNGQVVVGATGADPAFATLTSSGSTLTYTTGANTLNIDVTAPLNVAHGGTGDTSFTPYEVIVANTTGTGALTQVSGVGTSGQVLTSNGAAMFPTWQSPALTLTSFTPFITFGGTQAAGWTYTTNVGSYSTIGNLVFISIHIVVSATSGTPAGNAGIGGLPFNINSSASYFPNFTGSFADFTAIGSNTYLSGVGASGTSNIALVFTYLTGVTGGVNPTFGNFQAGTSIYLDGWYSV